MHYYQLYRDIPRNSDNNNGLMYEWSGFGDVGRWFPSGLLTLPVYEEVEKRFESAILLIVNHLFVQKMKFSRLEKLSRKRRYSHVNLSILRKKKFYSTKDLAQVLRILFRGDCNGILCARNKLYFFVYFDMCILLATHEIIDDLVPAIHDLGLRLEPRDSSIF